MSNLKLLNQPVNVGGVRLKNRIILAPMHTNYANADGSLSRKQFAYLAERARGGTGLLITEATNVSFPYGKMSERHLTTSHSVCVPELHDLIDTVHGFGAKIIPQLQHAGMMAVPAYNQEVQSMTASAYGDARAMTKEDIDKVINDFVEASKMAYNLGFDGIELHGAHKYLLNQFMSPITNQRTDEYGGSLENRFRFVKEIIEKIREACPRPFIISVRMGVLDHEAGGITLDEGVQFCKWCEDAGADMLNVSCGFYTSISQSTESQWEEEGDRVFLAEAVKKAVTIPVAVVGKLKNPELMADVIEEGKADMICVGRQLICDPYFPNKIFTGHLEDIRTCLSCDEGCIKDFYYHHGNVHCSLNPHVGYEDLYNEIRVPRTGIVKKIVVVGGGIAGMQFAITAKKRGHEVILLEKSNELGGQMSLAAVPPFKGDVRKAENWFIHEVNKLGVDIRLNTEATVDTIKALNPDTVVLAVGSLPNTPRIPGVEKTIESWDVLKNSALIPDNNTAVIIGGGVVGSELAHMLCEKGCRVTILEMLPELCRGHELMHKAKLEEYLAAHADVHLSVTVTEITDSGVNYKDAEGTMHTVEAENVILSVGQHPIGQEMYEALLDDGIDTYTIGDATKAGNFRTATRAALDLAYAI